MTTSRTGGSAGNGGATNGDERADRPRRRKGVAEERVPTARPKRAAPGAASRPTSGARGRRAPDSAASARPPQPVPAGEPEPVLPEEVVDEAAPLLDRVPRLTPAAEPATESAPGETTAAAAELPASGPLDEAPADIGRPAEPAEPMASVSAPAGGARMRGRRGRDRGAGPRGNALGALIEQHFDDPSSPVRSYSELERRSDISREALSRYVTPRADRRRSPTIDTLAAIADAMHLSLEQVCRAAVASAHGIALPLESEQRARDEVVAPLVAALTEDQFAAVVELLRQMRPH